MFFISCRLLFAPTFGTSPLISALSQTTRTARIAPARLSFAKVTAFLNCKASYTQKAVDMETVDTASRLSELRKLMKERNIDVYS